jgi:hypothetical protein
MRRARKGRVRPPRNDGVCGVCTIELSEMDEVGPREMSESYRRTTHGRERRLGGRRFRARREDTFYCGAPWLHRLLGWVKFAVQ